MRLVDEGLDGEELEGRDADPLQVVDQAGLGEGGVGAAPVGRDGRVELRQPLDVGLVDQGLGPAVQGAASCPG
jgi:hypothetical protein